jgi:hypothetical protein
MVNRTRQVRWVSHIPFGGRLNRIRAKAQTVVTTSRISTVNDTNIQIASLKMSDLFYAESGRGRYAINTRCRCCYLSRLHTPH